MPNPSLHPARTPQTRLPLRPPVRPDPSPLRLRGRRRARRAGAVLAVTAGLLAGTALPVATAPPAAATEATPAAAAVLATAEAQVGAPYRYGGTSPAGFDCSGFTRWVFAQHAIGLARTADAQMRSTRPVAAADARPGDLVYVVSGGRASHAAVYAGDGWIYDAAGGGIRHRPLWTGAVVYARVLA